MIATIAAIVLVGTGLALVVVGVLLRGRERERSLADILDLPFGERDVPIEAVTETRAAMFDTTTGLAGRVVEALDTRGRLSETLERARIPLKPGEYVSIAAAGALIAGALLAAVTGQPLFAVGGAGGVLAVAHQLPSWRVVRRRKAFEEQLPDALAMIAGSLAAGHTFLRAIQMMCEESEPPLAEEFARVVEETRLGGTVVDALDRMAQRLQIADLVWVVQALRIQQSVGGKLADLLHTLTDFIRAREEIRREVSALTAEGRISAWVLGALPVLLLVAAQVVSPDYMRPMFHGWGVIVLALTGVSVGMGVAIIRRMVRIEV